MKRSEKQYLISRIITDSGKREPDTRTVRPNGSRLEVILDDTPVFVEELR